MSTVGSTATLVPQTALFRTSGPVSLFSFNASGGSSQFVMKAKAYTLGL